MSKRARGRNLSNVTTRVHVGKSMIPIGNRSLIDTLVQCGVQLPEECVTVEMKVSADSLMQITYTCNVTGDLAHKIGKALQVQAVKDRLA